MIFKNLMHIVWILIFSVIATLGFNHGYNGIAVLCIVMVIFNVVMINNNERDGKK